MRDKFPGHFQKSSEKITEIWNEAYFMMDANILLNLYRYSESTKHDFLKILTHPRIKVRLWLPHRAAQEYLQNRSTVIAEQSKSYIDMIDSIKAFKNNLDNKRRHPFVSDKLKLNVDKVLGSLMDELEKSHGEHESRHSNDTIKENIDHLFGNQITEKYDDKRLQKLFIDGENRFKEKIPPGYKDIHKASDDMTLVNKTRVYGDLILWNQMIDFAKNKKTNIIFVTDDKKEDWWTISSGKTLGPRPELIEEFESETNQSILIYQADRFFEYSSNFLSQHVSPGSKDEISELTKRNFRLETEKARLTNTQMETLELTSKIKEIESRMNQLKSSRLIINSNLEHFKKYADEKMIENAELELLELDFELRNLVQQHSDFKAQLEMKQSVLNGLSKVVSFL